MLSPSSINRIESLISAASALGVEAKDPDARRLAQLLADLSMQVLYDLRELQQAIDHRRDWLHSSSIWQRAN